MIGPLEIAILAIAALIPAAIARHKGRSTFGFWLFGLVLWPAALVVSLVVSDQRHRCPHCMEPIHRQANVCPHCHSDLTAAIAT